MSQSSGSGSLLVPLLILLALLGGAGVWNHQRNVALEDAEFRPYRTLSTEDLATLLAATEAEFERLDARYASARGRRASTEIRGTHTEERLRDFERVQAHGRSVRSLGHRASELGGTLEEMRNETARRAGEGDELKVFLRRLLTLP